MRTKDDCLYAKEAGEEQQYWVHEKPARVPGEAEADVSAPHEASV